MRSIGLEFMANLALVMITGFIITTYLFRSSENSCQMTFMMEPPKFLPVPLDDTIKRSVQQPESINDKSSYILYMYSEFGFPTTSNVRRDLKDSMPVLFVPGNAGSYQQVRSLASTCIRRQLQSLDAYKFIFYTIDFKGQFSGISGKLIDSQISFVQKSLDQIALMHPPDVNGIIVVGHSVGGFITKALYTRPNFNPSRVPLLINLASPLKSSYLNFDDHMRRLYDRANEYWSANSSKINTLSISISGGKSDKLVPMHLSLDESYDLSLTTTAIRDIWLTTDHVSITWCRELMQILAHLLSAVMDKKYTRILEDKQKVIGIMKNKLLTDELFSGSNRDLTVKQKDYRIARSYDMSDFEGFHSITRGSLLDKITVLNLTDHMTSDLAIWVEHIEPQVRENRIFACNKITIDDHRTLCNDKIELVHLLKAIPTRKYQPKKSILVLDRKHMNQIHYLVIDFYSNSRDEINKVPELVSIQSINSRERLILYVPNIVEYLFSYHVYGAYFNREISLAKSNPNSIVQFEVTNLNYATQFYTIDLETKNCKSGDSLSEPIALLYHGKYLTESFHLDKSDQQLKIRLNSHDSVRIRSNDADHKNTHLNLIIDKTCDNTLHIRLDLWNLIEDTIQRNLGQIFTCLTYLAYASIVTHILMLERGHFELSIGDKSWHLLANILVTILLSSKLVLRPRDGTSYPSIDETVRLSLIIFLSNGTLALIKDMFKRVVDLATIVNDLQSMISSKINIKRPSSNTNQTNGHNNIPTTPKKEVSPQRRRIPSWIKDPDWLIVLIGVCGSLLLSEAIASFCQLMIIIKLSVALNAAYYRSIKPVTTDRGASSPGCCSASSQTSPPERNLHEIYFELMVRVAALCVLALIANIPNSLVKLSTFSSSSSIGFKPENWDFVVPSTCLLLVKLISIMIDSISQDGYKSASRIRSWVHRIPTRHLHLAALVSIFNVEANIVNSNLVLITTLIWAKHRLLKIEFLGENTRFKHNGKHLKSD